jgi:hypothetical protein
MTSNTDQTTPKQMPPNDTRVTFTWQAILRRKFAAEKGRQGALQGILEALKTLSAQSTPVTNPLHVFADEEAAKASPIGKLIAAMKTPVLKKGEVEPPLFCPLSEQVKENEARAAAVAKRREEELSAANAKREAAIEADRARRVERARQREEEDKLLRAAGLGNPQEDEKERVMRLMVPWITGQACVVRDYTDERNFLTKLVYEKREIDIVDTRNFVQKVRAMVAPGEPASYTILCPFCGKTVALGDKVQYRATVYEMIDGVRKPKFNERKQPIKETRVASAMSILYLPARTADGKAEYVYTKGDRQGQLRKQPVLCCNACAQMARHYANREQISKDNAPFTMDAYVQFRKWDDDTSEIGRVVAVGVPNERNVPTPTSAPAPAGANPRRRKGSAKSATLSPKGTQGECHGTVANPVMKDIPGQVVPTETEAAYTESEGFSNSPRLNLK